MKTITPENAKTKTDFAALIFAHKNEDFNSFMAFTEDILKQYAQQFQKCHSCGVPISNECSRCKRLWAT